MNGFGRILVGVDGSAGSEAALRWALREATLRAGTSAGAAPAVTALLAWTGDGLPSDVLRAVNQAKDGGLATAAGELLERVIVRVGEPAAPVELRRLVVHGNPVPTLMAAARNYELLVVGERGHGPIHRLTTGSVSQGIVRHAPVPVVVVRSHGEAATPEHDDRPVVVGVDGSDPSRRALRWAAHEAALRGVGLRIVHAWGGHDPMYSEVLVSAQGSLLRQAEDILDRAVAQGLDHAADLAVDTVVSPDSAIRALLRESREAQLLVIGSRGLGGFSRLLLGSVSQQCVLHAASDVAVIRPRPVPVPADHPAGTAAGATVPVR